MATPPPGIEGGPAAPPAPPGTDMTGMCFRDQLWLNSYPLDRNLVFDYFALSPFYDLTCNNEQLRMRSIHPLDLSHLSKMIGTEYMLNEVMEPNFFVIRKQKRDGPEKVTPMLTYYVLDGSIYQAPQLCNVFAARVGRALYYISKAFNTAASKVEKIGYVESENENAVAEPKASKEMIDFKEVKRIDHILASLQRKAAASPLWASSLWALNEIIASFPIGPIRIKRPIRGNHEPPSPFTFFFFFGSNSIAAAMAKTQTTIPVPEELRRRRVERMPELRR